MNIVIIFCLVAAAGFFGYRMWLRRPRSKASVESIYLLIYDGSSYVLYDAARQDGCFVVNSIEYPASACRRVEMVSDVHLHVYVFAAEAIALTTHQQLMKNRAAIVKGHLFKGGGDMKQLINMVAAGAVIACALFVYMAVGSINSANVQQQVLLEKIDKWTQSPIVQK